MARPRGHDPSLRSFIYFFPAGQTDHIWSDEAAASTTKLGGDVFLEMARAAEDAGFDATFIADTSSVHQRVAEKGNQVWGDFARTGDPRSSGELDWPPLNASDAPVMVLDLEPVLGDRRPDGLRMAFWDRNHGVADELR